jgi:hypothetical protein
VAVDRVDAASIHDGQYQVNLSASLQWVPGISVQSRQNYAQELQIPNRGFGARSSSVSAAPGHSIAFGMPRIFKPMGVATIVRQSAIYST